MFLIDPWLTGNPLAPLRLDELPAADFALFTHDHEDHTGDAVAVSAHTGAVLVGQPETTSAFQERGAKRVLAMNIGGSVDLDGVIVTMTDACHTSATGVPASYVLTLEDGKVLYHAGDTGLHANMAIWGELFDIDIALLPIGDRFTMDARQAAKALKLLRAKAVLPMHYKTFPLLAQDATQFVKFAEREAPRTKVHVVEPGEELTF
ncbi:metal-dependent hydrolase [Mesorhizobium sp. M0622]